MVCIELMRVPLLRSTMLLEELLRLALRLEIGAILVADRRGRCRTRSQYGRSQHHGQPSCSYGPHFPSPLIRRFVRRKFSLSSEALRPPRPRALEEEPEAWWMRPVVSMLSDQDACPLPDCACLFVRSFPVLWLRRWPRVAWLWRRRGRSTLVSGTKSSLDWPFPLGSKTAVTP